MNPTTPSHWLTLVSEAKIATGSIISEQAENYLIGLLTHFSAKPLTMARALAFDFLSDPAMQAKSLAEQLKTSAIIAWCVPACFPIMRNDARSGSDRWSNWGSTHTANCTNLRPSNTAGSTPISRTNSSP